MVFAPQSAENLAEFFRNRTDTICISESDGNSNDRISLSKLHRVLLYEPEEMVIQVEGGIMLSELEKTLSQSGQWIPTLVTAESPEQTLYESVFADRFHPRAASLGMLRTTMLGGTFCTTDGTLFKSGSRVVKSVAGYDIHRAFCGSKGFFGAIVSLILKVQPKPEAFLRFTTTVEYKSELLRYAPSVLHSDGSTLIVELAGYKEDIEADKYSLSTTAIPLNPIGNDEWNTLIRQIRTKPRSCELQKEAVKLLKSVQEVFDPKGILL